MPKLVGKTLARAKAALSAAHCSLGKVSRSKRKRRGERLLVHSSSPAAGASLPVGAAVDIPLDAVKHGNRKGGQ